MNKIFFLLSLVFIFFALISCEDALFKSPSASKKEVYKEFWTQIDEKYSFFNEKHINWSSQYNRINHISDELPDEDFFDTLAVVLDVLKDGHCSLTSPFNSHKNPDFFLQSPENYSSRLIYDYYSNGWPNVTGSMAHFTVARGKVAYIHYASFMNEVTDADIDYLLQYYKNTDGLIFDVRENTGGDVTNVFKLVSRFVNHKTLVYKTRVKAGPDHSDFTEPIEIHIDHKGENYNGYVCVLTNRKTFSAGSVFTLCMRELPNVTVVGDTTGGGLGLPIGMELANGWQLRFAGTQILSADEECFEMGVPPDVPINMSAEDEDKGIDSIIEKAVEIIENNN